MPEPKVRFKRDDGRSYPTWETIPMSEIFTEISEKNHPEMPVLSVQQGVGTVLRDASDRNILYDKSNLKNYKAMKKDDYIIHLRSFEGGLECSNYDGISSPAYRILRAQKIIPSAYRDYFRSYEFIHNKLAVSVVGIRDGKNIDMETFWQIPMSVPCTEEQQKIADFLSSVDEIITASEEEVANLEKQKKAVMKKIFSREVRFKRDDGSNFPEWEKVTFDNAFNPLNNNTFSRDMLNYDDGPALNIHYGDILVKYGDVCDVNIDVLPYVNEGIDVSRYAKLIDGDIVLADTAEDETVGKAVEVINIGKSIVVSGLHTMACRPKRNYSPKYLGYFMNSPAFHDQLKPFMQGIKVTSIGRKNIAKVMVMYPRSFEEQRLIADFLSAFDEAIAAAKKELELWKELKKGLLQQMFV